ncbi:MAG: hypothetical protein A3A13_03135 [Candidatus Yanofskybacteria bacterium RIFCSPLOWO2_01_FULL_43_22]|uniref:Uncharacterized protein n=1 Tax=Candidatus Yanofskybacteria bacterium RIFCSPLOWO2_01_FULL_43_22 TaxID=1802695 RepID=A0A1F8GL50_9BACT|nr:MAG: hypothetical protein A3A13_03135 [Candidatus Yanofskybacteria bacterium RIFCSPLOWO2_01_FULL_43_22]
MEENTHHYRIATWEAGFMIGVAIVFDGVAALLGLLIIGGVVNSFVAIVASFVFGLWLHSKKVSLADTRVLIRMVSGLVIELIPIVNILPAWTFCIVSTILLTRLQDKSKIVSAVSSVVGRSSKQAITGHKPEKNFPVRHRSESVGNEIRETA